MGVYIFMLSWVIVFGIVSNITSRRVCVLDGVYENRSKLLTAILVFSVIIFFAGFRSQVGDTAAYIKGFKEYTTIDAVFKSNTRDIGFDLISVLLKNYVSDNYTVWLMIIAIVSGLCVMIPLYKYSCNFGVSAFLFITSCQFTWMFNGMRQFLVASIIFACTGLILKNKTLLYIIIVCILSTIHQSALLLIPMYFIAQGEPWNRRTILFIVCIVLATVFASRFTNMLTDVVEQTNYATSVNEFKDTDDGTSPIRILVESIPVIMAFIYRYTIKHKLTPIIKLSINMSLIASGLYIISKVASSGILLGRLPIYFSMYNLILLPWLLKNIFNRKEKNFVYYIMIVCYFAFFYYQMEVAWGGLEYVSEILNMKY